MYKPIATRVILSFLLSFLFLLSSCSPSTPPPLPTETQPPSPTTAPPETALPTETPTAFPTLAPELERPQYVIDLQMNYSAKAAEVNQTITYPNWTGETLTNLVLAVEPNLWSGGFNLRSLSADGLPVFNYTLEALSQRLEIVLPQPLPPSGTLTLNLTYSLILPKMQAYSDPNEIRPQIYGYSDRQINFVDWYPFIVPYQPGEGWILHNPWFYGEHLVYDVADFDVTVTFTDGTTPQIAASGAEAASGSATSRKFELEAGRTFALSMSTDYKIATQMVGDVKVFAYYFAFYDEEGEALLQTTAQALQVFTDKFGPYRHKTMTAVQGDFNDGMEYSAFYFISRDYFNLYDGTPVNYLVTIGAHETAHQWWFDAVANDQGVEPWLDEALATYSERVYYEAIYPDLVASWQSYRYFEFQNAGFVDTQVYDGDGQRPYWDKVYLTGARFLQELRERVGDEIFFAFLKDYYAQYAGSRATAVDFFRVLREHTSADLSDLMAKYFQKTY
ncbi:MAG TPA: M1 family aminopeptidase [Anaerolineales bacterium]|nr:M1 family aminopeptidase [Anaerolineales bacterium]